MTLVKRNKYGVAASIALALALMPIDANAWFFFLFPIPSFGGGSSGGICVGSYRKEGDIFRSVNGNVATIKTIEGTSSRCKDPNLPVFAKVEFAPPAFTPNAGIKLPDGYSPQSLTDLQRFNGQLLLARQQGSDSGVLVTAIKRDVISDMQTYAARLKAEQAKRIDEPVQSDIESLTINGLPAWRFETKGKSKNLFGTRYTYHITVLEGDTEVVTVNAWTTTGNFERYPDDYKQIAFGVTGLKPPLAVAIKSGTAAPAPTVEPSDAQTKPAEANSLETATPPALPVQANLPTSATSASSTKNSADRLRELSKLYKEGVLTEHEYESKKQEILKSM